MLAEWKCIMFKAYPENILSILTSHKLSPSLLADYIGNGLLLFLINLNWENFSQDETWAVK